MIACTCGYTASGMVPMMAHLAGAHAWPPDDVTAWMVQYVTDAWRNHGEA
jgi:hypothetical protein